MASKDHVFGLTSICSSNGIYFITKKLMLTYSLGLQRPRLGGATAIRGQWRSSHCRLPCCKTQVFFFATYFICPIFYLPKQDSKLKYFQFLCDFVVSHHTGIFCIMECTAQWALVESDVWWSTQSLGPSPSTVGTYLITCSRNHSHTCTKGFWDLSITVMV